MQCVIEPSTIKGVIHISPSKSETMRAIAFAAMARGTSYITNILQSPDTYAMVKGIEGFGARVRQKGSTLEVLGTGGNLRAPDHIIDVGNSGLALRFLAAMAALVEEEVLITGDESIKKRRPISPLLKVYQEGGMEVLGFDDNADYISLKGKLKPGTIMIEGQDSQLVSSLLFTTAFLGGPSEIFVINPGEKPWVGLTINWLEYVGGSVYNQAYCFYELEGELSYDGFSIKIGGDYSTALFSLASAIIAKKPMIIYGLDEHSMQADKYGIEIFKKMGAKLAFNIDKGLEVIIHNNLTGIDVDINHCIDVLPILSVLASFASSPTIIRGAHIARFKESNRIEDMIEELKKMGAKIEARRDGMIIHPSKLYGAILEGKNDHRIILSLIVAAAAAKGTSIIRGVEHIVKSYPTGIYDFISCGMKIDIIL